MYYHIENGYIMTQKHETFVMIWVLIEDKVDKSKCLKNIFFFWKLSRKCSREVPVFTSLFETADGKQWMVTLHQIIVSVGHRILPLCWGCGFSNPHKEFLFCIKNEYIFAIKIAHWYFSFLFWWKFHWTLCIW